MQHYSLCNDISLRIETYYSSLHLLSRFWGLGGVRMGRFCCVARVFSLCGCLDRGMRGIFVLDARSLLRIQFNALLPLRLLWALSWVFISICIRLEEAPLRILMFFTSSFLFYFSLFWRHLVLVLLCNFPIFMKWNTFL